MTFPATLSIPNSYFSYFRSLLFQEDFGRITSPMRPPVKLIALFVENWFSRHLGCGRLQLQYTSCCHSHAHAISAAFQEDSDACRYLTATLTMISLSVAIHSSSAPVAVYFLLLGYVWNT